MDQSFETFKDKILAAEYLKIAELLGFADDDFSDEGILVRINEAATTFDVGGDIAARDSEIANLRQALVEAEAVMAKNIYPKPDVSPEHPWSVLQRVRAAISRTAKWESV